MANFDSPGAGLSRGLRAGFAISGARKDRELEANKQKQEEAEAALQRINDAGDEAREMAVNNVSTLATHAGEAAAKGAAPEQLQKIRQAAFASAMTYGNFLEESKAFAEQSGNIDSSIIPSGKDFVDQQMSLYDAEVQSSSIDDFEILSPEAIAKEIPQLENTDAIVQRNKATGKIELLFPSGGSESTIAERIRLLTPLMGEERATLVATTAAVVVTDPVTGISGVINKGTGDQIGPTIEPPAAPAEETTVIPDDIKTSAATGVKGIVINVANTVRDAFGMGLQDPEAQDATDALTTIQTLTSLHLLQEISGRDTDGLRKRLDKLTVTPNSFFQGEERSKNRLQDTQQVLQGEIDRMENQLKTEIDPATRIKLQNNIPQIKRLRDAYGTLVTGFDIEEEEVEVDVEGERLLDKHAPIAGSKKVDE